LIRSIEYKILKKIGQEPDSVLNLYGRKDREDWLKTRRLQSDKTSSNVLKKISLLKRRQINLEGVNKRRFKLERVTGQCIKDLKGIYPVSTNNGLSDILSFIVFYQSRLEAFVLYDQIHLKGKCSTQHYDFHHTVAYLWKNMMNQAQSAVLEGRWKVLKYKIINNDLCIVKLDNFPCSFYLNRRTLSGIKNKKRFNGPLKLYDQWIIKVLSHYKVFL